MEKAFVRVIFQDEITDQNLIPIGKIQAASSWHGAPADETEEFYKARALRNLIDTGQDYEADAITAIGYRIEHVDAGDTPGSAPLKRICATGIAARLVSFF
jgi:hypothetical protein